MEGMFTAGPAITPVYPGDQVKVVLGYWAINPGAITWKTFLIGVCHNRLRQEIDATREWGELAERPSKSYWLGDYTYGRLYMPNTQIAITFFLFGHDDAGYDFDWGEFDLYLQGYDTEIVPLCYAVIYLSPKEVGEPAVPVLPDNQIVYVPQPDGTAVEEEKPVYVPPPAKAFPTGAVLIGAGALIIIGSFATKGRLRLFK